MEVEKSRNLPLRVGGPRKLMVIQPESKDQSTRVVRAGKDGLTS